MSAAPGDGDVNGSPALWPTAAPRAPLAAGLRRASDERLLESLGYLAKEGHRELGLPSTAAAIDAVAAAREELRPGARLRGTAYVLNTELAHSMREQDGPRVRALLELAARSRLTGSATELHTLTDSPDDEETILLAAMDREHSREYDAAFDARHVSPDAANYSTEQLEYALNALREVDPPAASEFDELVTDIVVLGSTNVNAGTSARALGYLLLRELTPERNWTTCYEAVVHETGHLYLFLLFRTDPLVLNDAASRFSSPIRPGGRPLSAVLHAAFVLARTVRSVRLAAETPAYSDDIANMSTSYNAAKNVDDFPTKFYEAYETLMEHGEFTAFGSQLLRSCEAMVAGTA